MAVLEIKGSNDTPQCKIWNGKNRTYFEFVAPPPKKKIYIHIKKYVVTICTNIY
jgi:hypothetical protein